MKPILLALAALQSAPDAGQDPYRACTALVRTSPEAAVERANGWRLTGGGLEARQCLGLAYVALGRWSEAAAVYDDAARDAARADDPRRADLWVQAANAWLADGEPTRAILAIDEALKTPDLSEALRGEAHIDRARALVALNEVAGARADLDRALQLVPEDPFGWYLSAALAEREGSLDRARSDIERAMKLAPDDPELVLFAGTLAGRAGDMAEAERLYRRVAEGAPETEAGRKAKASLETLADPAGPDLDADAE